MSLIDSERRPIVGITMGDAAGIGPEIVAKALCLAEIYELCRPIVLGDHDALIEGIRTASVDLRIHSVKRLAESKYVHGSMDVLDFDNIDIKDLDVFTHVK